MIYYLDMLIQLFLLCGILMSGFTLYMLISAIHTRNLAHIIFLSITFFLAWCSFALFFTYQEILEGLTLFGVRIVFIGLFCASTSWALFFITYAKRSTQFSIFQLCLVICTGILSLFMLVLNRTDLIIIEFVIPSLDPGIDQAIRCFFNPLCVFSQGYVLLLLAIPVGLLFIDYHRATPQGRNHIFPVLIASLVPFLYILLFFINESSVVIPAAPVIAIGMVLITWYRLIKQEPVIEFVHASEHLFHHIQAGVIVLNKEMLIINVNPAAEEMFDLTLPQVYAEHITHLLPDVDLLKTPPDEDYIINKISHGVEHSFSFECINIADKNNTNHATESGYIIILHDVSRQILAEADRRENLEFLQHLILTIPIPLFFTDNDNYFRGCNPAFCSFFFLPEDMILKQPIDKIIQPITNIEVHNSVIGRLFETGGVEDYEISVDVDGTIHDILMTVAGYTDSNKSKNGLIGAFLDITDIHLYQEALETTNKKLHMLSSITRHDILNQITSFMLYVGVMQESEAYETDPEVKTFIDKMEVLGSMIHKEILFSKDYEEMGIENPVWVVISEKIYHLQSAKTFEQVTITDHTKNLRIYADPLFERVLYNLFENALRHGGCVTAIDVSFSVRDDTKGVLIVSDNGNGVPDAMKEKIFLKGVGSNTGLGLFLTKEILAITKIEITETGTEGCGARFEMVIPSGRFQKDE